MANVTKIDNMLFIQGLYQEQQQIFLFNFNVSVVLFTRVDPDRFAPEVAATRPRYSFVPFGFCGGRQCPGFR